MNLIFQEKINKTIKNYSNKIAMTFLRNDNTEDNMTFKEIGSFIRAQEIFFKHIGMLPGDRVAIICSHSPWAVINILALSYSNITCVPIDSTLPVSEIEELLEFSNVKALFSTDCILQHLDTHVLQSILCFEILDKGILQPFYSSIPAPSNIATANPETDVIAILFSSGTTGQMKGIKITYDSVIKARLVFERLSGLKDYMSYLLVLPFNHIAGFTGAMTYFLTGCTLGFIEDVDSSKLQNGFKKFQPHYFAMVPKVYEVIEQKIRNSIHEKGKLFEITILSLLKFSGILRKNFGINIGKRLFKKITDEVFGKNIFGLGTGASPCKDSTTEFFLNLGLEWSNLYATTETNVPISATGILDKYPVGTVGNVNRHPEIDIKIANPDSKGIGEIHVQSELMMKGYFREPELINQAFEDGYFKTGDLGYIDSKKYLHITGRIKESIILENGKKVSPADVDEYYTSKHPEYIMACRGIPTDAGSEDKIFLFIEEKTDDIHLRHTIKNLLLETSRTAPSMYRIHSVCFVKQIPFTSVGKVKRYLLSANTNKPKGKTDTVKTTNDEEMLLSIVSKYSANADIYWNSLLKEDLGIDSLTMFELACEIESTFHTNIIFQLDNILRVSHLLEYTRNAQETEVTGYNSQSYPLPKTNKMIRSLKRWMSSSKVCYRFTIGGKENIPLNSNYLISSNHASYLDPVWILTAMEENLPELKDICCLAAKHTMKGMISNNLFNALGSIPVDRDGNTSPSLSCAQRCLLEGKNLIIFPEGARSRDGSLLRFKHGTAKLAIDTQKQILPVRIDGGFEIFPRTQKVPHIFNWRKMQRYELKIQFGPPLSPRGKTVQELTHELRKSIEGMK